MIRLEVNNKNQYRINKTLCQKVADKVSGKLKIKKEYEVSLAFVSRAQIKRLNSIYRKINEPTDVLSFAEENFFNLPGERYFLGEVIICYPVLAEQARQKKHSQKKELAVLLTHGLLHLLGYDHEKNSEAEKMEALERELLKSFEKSSY